MTDPPCERCARPIHDTAYVHQECTRTTAELLRLVASIAGEAQTTIARLSVTGDGGGVSDPDPDPWDRTGAALVPMALPVDLGAAQRWDTAVMDLLTTAKHIVEERGRPVDYGQGHPLAGLVTWLADQLGWLRYRREGLDLLDGMDSACRQLVAVVDRRADRWYAGPCGTELVVGQCPEELYPVAGASTYRCQHCGTVHDLDVRKQWLLDQVDELLYGAAWISASLARLGLLVNLSTITTWVDRGRLTAHGRDAYGHALLKVGEVRALVEERDRIKEQRDVQAMRRAAEKALRREQKEMMSA